MALKRIGTPKKIFSEIEPAYEQRAVWIETDNSGNIISQYVGLFDQWVEIPVTGQYPIHFDHLQSTEPTAKAGESWLSATSFSTQSVSTPTTGDNLYEFNIDSLSNVFNVNSVTVKGIRNEAANSVSKNNLLNNDTINYNVGGTVPAENSTVTFTGIKNTQNKTYSGNSSGTTSISLSGNKPPQNASVTLSLQEKSISSYTNGGITLPSNAPQTTYTISGNFGLDSNSSDDTYSLTITKNGSSFYSAGLDEQFYGASPPRWTTTNFSTSVSAGPGDTIRWDAGESYDYDYVNIQGSKSPSETVTVNPDVSSPISFTASTSQVTKSLPLSTSDSSVNISVSNANISSWSISYDDITQTSNPQLTVDGETVVYTGDMSNGQTVTKSLSNLTPGSHSATVSVEGAVDVNSSWTEVTQTNDPVVRVNNNNVSYNGTLSGTESTNLSVEKSWLVSGANAIELLSGGPADLIFEYDEVDSTSTNLTVRLYYSDGVSWKEIN